MWHLREYERQITELKEQLEIERRPQNDSKRELEELQNAFTQAKRTKQGLDIEVSAKEKDAAYLHQEIVNANEK